MTTSPALNETRKAIALAARNLGHWPVSGTLGEFVDAAPSARSTVPLRPGSAGVAASIPIRTAWNSARPERTSDMRSRKGWPSSSVRPSRS
jgi:hypothetical protein